MAPPAHAGQEDSRAKLTRRTMIATSVATGVATLGNQAAIAQSTPPTPGAEGVATPAASPIATSEIDTGKLMMLSANLCGGARLNPAQAEGLITLLAGEENVNSPLEELFAVEWFTPESLAETSPEAQRVAKNILQYWFLGRYDGELVENRSKLYIELASWQSLPYQTQQGACKGLNYWAEEVNIKPTGE